MTKMKGTEEMTNILDLADQALFLGERATGATSVIQCIWVYDRAIDIDGLRRFHHHLQRGRLARRIERSPLPFGRHRWVMGSDSSDIEFTQTPRPREEFDAWLTDQAHTPLDAEHGPGWHLAVAAIHRRRDRREPGSRSFPHRRSRTGHGVGRGDLRPLTMRSCGLAAGSRRRWRALREDARQTARDIPAVGRATRAAFRMARRHRGDAKAPARASKHIEFPDERITLPSATAFIDASEWDARAQSLGGTSNALLAGLAADAAQRMGRVTAGDGAVMLSIPVNERTDGDTRANAVTNVDVTVDPTNATTDLRGIRAAIKQALVHHNAVPDERLALLPIVPLVPKRLMRRMVSVATGNAASVVSSNLGEVPSAVDPAGRHRRGLLHGAVRLPGGDPSDDAPHGWGPGLHFGTGQRQGRHLGAVVSAGPSQLGCRAAADAFEHICRVFTQRDDGMEIV